MSTLATPCTACAHPLAQHWEGGCSECGCGRSISVTLGQRALRREVSDARPRCACGHAAARHFDYTGPCSLRVVCKCEEFRWPPEESA